MKLSFENVCWIVSISASNMKHEGNIVSIKIEMESKFKKMGKCSTVKIVHVYRHERQVTWHPVMHNRFEKIGTDCRMRGNHIKSEIERLSRENPIDKIIILTGGHGYANGRNYKLINKQIMRDPHARKIKCYKNIVKIIYLYDLLPLSLTPCNGVI